MENTRTKRTAKPKEALRWYEIGDSKESTLNPLKLTRRGKRALAGTAAGLIAITTAISLSSMDRDIDQPNDADQNPYQEIIDKYNDERNFEVHVGDNNVIVLEDGARMRHGPFVADHPNYTEVNTDGDQAMIKPELIITYTGDAHNGDWYGVPVESVNDDPVLDGFKDELLLGDGLLWVSSQKSSIKLDESAEDN